MTARSVWALALLLASMAPVAPLGAQAAAPTTPAPVTPYLVALSVSSVDSSLAWYRRYFRFDLMRAPYRPAAGVRIAFLAAGEFRLELVELAGSRARRAAQPDSTNEMSLRGYVKLGLRVSELDVLAARFRQDHVTFVFGPAVDSAFQTRHFIVADPDDNLVQVFQPPGP